MSKMEHVAASSLQAQQCKRSALPIGSIPFFDVFPRSRDWLSREVQAPLTNTKAASALSKGDWVSLDDVDGRPDEKLLGTGQVCEVIYSRPGEKSRYRSLYRACIVIEEPGCSATPEGLSFSAEVTCSPTVMGANLIMDRLGEFEDTSLIHI